MERLSTLLRGALDSTLMLQCLGQCYDATVLRTVPRCYSASERNSALDSATMLQCFGQSTILMSSAEAVPVFAQQQAAEQRDPCLPQAAAGRLPGLHPASSECPAGLISAHQC